ncbi:hypothetical protein ISO28_13490 [Staphylococcus haemolyticus]|nr:hypothetical protein [Staphylococcus haemolyticus]
MMKKDLLIRDVDSELLDRLSRLAKDKNISRNKLILEQSHQQAQNTKILKEVASKQDKILALLESVDY